MSGIAAQARVAADLAVGVSVGSGPRDEHSGFSVDATVTLHSSRGSLGRFIAIAGTTEGGGPHGDKCYALEPFGPCRGPLTFRSVSALVGADVTVRWLTAGVAIGPSVYVSSEHITAAGVQARMQLVTPGRSPVALVVTGRRSWLPNYRSAHYEVSAVTIGMRVRHRSSP